MSLPFPQDLTGIGNMIAAVGALGSAAFGLVDATKVYRGGVSNIGYKSVKAAVKPYEDALKLVNSKEPYATILANWLNGVAKDDQKAAVKSLIRLGLTGETAPKLAAAAPGIDKDAFTAAAKLAESGAALGQQDIAVLGRFDAIVDSQLDAGFERADQQYRNSAKVLAAVFAIVLAVVGGKLIAGDKFETTDFVYALFVGLIATPLAPVAKDVTSAINSAVAALKSA